MTEEDNELHDDEAVEKQEQKAEEKPKIDAFDQLATGAPARQVDLPRADTPNGHNGKSLDDAMDSPNLTDHQATLQFMFPTIPITYIQRISRVAMMARIFPEAFLDHIRMNVIAIVQEMEADGVDVNVTEVINLVHHVYSIGLGGKGRIDGLELAGAAKEAELEKLSKMVGLND